MRLYCADRPLRTDWAPSRESLPPIATGPQVGAEQVNSNDLCRGTLELRCARGCYLGLLTTISLNYPSTQHKTFRHIYLAKCCKSSRAIMAETNGITKSEDTTTASTSHLGKRKRTPSPEASTSSPAAETSPLQAALENVLQLLRKCVMC